ncbi:MAG: GNAT family N-acetyltransferase [Pseudomonadota bacterium]
MTEAQLDAKIHLSLAEIPAAEWDSLVPRGNPHLRHRFLALAESSGSVSNETGWQPCHISIRQDERLIGALPLYQKAHSWGEFIFDWSWAQAYQRAGIRYYPKLISATPFTPATAPKFLVADDADESVRVNLLQIALGFAQQHGFSSLHLQFLTESERQWCIDQDLLLRKDCQFHWFNREYQSFEQFVGTFSSKKRKNVNRERRRVREAGVSHRILVGAQITEEIMAEAWRLCSFTFLARGHEPYLSLGFFEQLRQAPNNPLVIVLAEHENTPVAAAILLHEDDVLLGRYWGSQSEFHSLHFETCYYQGIEFCIANNISRYEPGTQGEHKVARGFVPCETGSAHWLAEPAFADAITDYLAQEARGVDAYMDGVAAHVPYRKGSEREQE